jgi:hypothetical protein
MAGQFLLLAAAQSVMNAANLDYRVDSQSGFVGRDRQVSVVRQ